MKENEQINKNLYSQNFILGIDFGTKRTGLAIYIPAEDPAPWPLLTLQINAISLPHLLEEIKKNIKKYKIDLIVIGIPYLSNEKSTRMTKKVIKFFKILQSEVSPIKVLTQNESFSSFEAENRMKNSPVYNFQIKKDKLDALAAAIILEEWAYKKITV